MEENRMQERQTKERSCFIAVTGYSFENRFVFKEIGILCTKGRIINHWILKPPQPIHSLTPLERYIVFHSAQITGLTWDVGTVNYNSLNTIFELLSNKFNFWFVENKETKDRLFPFKSSKVEIHYVQKKKYLSTEKKFMSVTCIQDHSGCVINNVIKLFQSYE